MAAETPVVLVTTAGVPETVVPPLQSELVLQIKETAVEVEPTVRVPFNVADVSSTEVGESVVIETAENSDNVEPIKEPPRAAFKAASSLASCS